MHIDASPKLQKLCGDLHDSERRNPQALWHKAERLVNAFVLYRTGVNQVSRPEFGLLEYLLKKIEEKSSRPTNPTRAGQFDLERGDPQKLVNNKRLLTSALLITLAEETNPSLSHGSNGLIIPEIQINQDVRADAFILDTQQELPVGLDYLKDFARVSFLGFVSFLEKARKKKGFQFSGNFVEIKTKLSPDANLPSRPSNPVLKQILTLVKYIAWINDGKLPDWYNGHQILYVSPFDKRVFEISKPQAESALALLNGGVNEHKLRNLWGLFQEPRMVLSFEPQETRNSVQQYLPINLPIRRKEV